MSPPPIYPIYWKHPVQFVGIAALLLGAMLSLQFCLPAGGGCPCKGPWVPALWWRLSKHMPTQPQTNGCNSGLALDSVWEMVACTDKQATKASPHAAGILNTILGRRATGVWQKPDEIIAPATAAGCMR